MNMPSAPSSVLRPLSSRVRPPSSAFCPLNGLRAVGLSVTVVFIGLLISAVGSAENPITKESFPDVNIQVVGDTAYAFGGIDLVPFDTNETRFLMPGWKVYSSKDLVNWTLESIRKPEDSYIGASDKCFAGHGIYHREKWYWYFSNFVTDTGVAVSDSIKGPWRDALGEPLLPKDLTPTHEYDNCVFVDEDGRAYIVFGSRLDRKHFGYHIAELNEDMISLKTKPRLIKIQGAPMRYERLAVDAPFLHKVRGKYYLSWRTPYALADHVLGPYTFAGVHSARGHGGFFEFKNQTYVNFTALRHGYRRKHRFTSLAYVHYRDDGSIGPMSDLIKEYGVGQYQAEWNKIEAEWYFELYGGEKREIPGGGGFEVRGLSNGDSLHFPNIHNFYRNAEVHFLGSAGADRGTIEIRQESVNGPLLGRVTIQPSGSWENYQTYSAFLKNPFGKYSLVFVFKSDSDLEFFRMDSFSLVEGIL